MCIRDRPYMAEMFKYNICSSLFYLLKFASFSGTEGHHLGITCVERCQFRRKWMFGIGVKKYDQNNCSFVIYTLEKVRKLPLCVLQEIEILLFY